MNVIKNIIQFFLIKFWINKGHWNDFNAFSSKIINIEEFFFDFYQNVLNSIISE